MSAEAATASEGTARDEGFSIVQSLDSSGLREIGSEATWLLSSAKPGNGVDQLRDDAVRPERHWAPLRSQRAAHRS